MSTTTRIFFAILWAIYGAILGLLLGFIYCVLTTNEFSRLHLFGEISSAIGAVYGLIKGPGVAAGASMRSSKPKSVDEVSRAVFGRSVTDNLPDRDSTMALWKDHNED